MASVEKVNIYALIETIRKFMLENWTHVNINDDVSKLSHLIFQVFKTKEKDCQDYYYLMKNIVELFNKIKSSTNAKYYTHAKKKALDIYKKDSPTPFIDQEYPSEPIGRLIYLSESANISQDSQYSRYD